MGDAEVPSWLKSLPLAPEYRPTETEFADPISFISKIEAAAAEFGICKVLPPIPKPSRKFVFHNLNRSLSKSPDLGPTVDGGNPKHAPESAVFTTRHQELGSRRTRMQAIHKQVWQSGELYTLEQFEAKARAFARAHLGGPKCVNPLLVEDMFWKAAEEKPIYIEYANDVPGSGFGVPKEPFQFKSRRRWRRRFNRGGGNMVEEQRCNMPLQVSECLGPGNEWEGSAGWKLSNSPWNLQVIARSPGSLTRFMPDEVPGVTSPMVYIGMLFSWFAWHVEDHELHSLNFLHTGASKTWYAVPGSYASKFEEAVRMQGYGGHVDRLAAFTLLGEKTTLMSPEVIVQSGIPCCRLVQHPGEFVVTFPRAYHVGFSHGFNCGEAANFATPKWLNVAKEAAVRRAAMNYLPMLSHQQLLYMLTMSFISRVPRAFLPGVRSSRLKDRKKEERETLVKKAFLDDLKDEHHLIHRLFGKDEAFYGVLWHPDLLPSPSNDSQKIPSPPCCEGSGFSVSEFKNEMVLCDIKTNVSPDPKDDGYLETDMSDGGGVNTGDIPPGNISSAQSQKYGDTINVLDSGRIQSSYVDDGDLPCGLDVDSGSVACVACGILGYPFMSIVQPSDKATKLLSAECEVTDEKVGDLKQTKTSLPFCLVDMTKESANSEDSAVSDSLPPTKINDSGCDNIMATIKHEVYQVGPADNKGPERNKTKVDLNESDLCDKLMKDDHSVNAGVIHMAGDDSENPSNSSRECCHDSGSEMVDLKNKWNTCNKFPRPRIFCLQHALEICELLESKGGAHVLIICHSDYLKIKAHAMSVAEDIDTQLDCEDVPLKDASQADLDLIYMSIDDEEHEEDGEDWTAKMGLNLRYCVKLRKQSSSNQEQLTLGLDGIFSNKSPPIISALTWHCRKSRTQQRMIAPAQSRSQSTVNIYKGKPAMKSSFPDPSARTQMDKTCSNEMQHKRRRGRPRKNPSADLVSRTRASAPDEKTSIIVPCSSKCLTHAAEVPVDGLSMLAGSPFTSALAPKDVQIPEECMIMERKEVEPSHVVDDSSKTEDTTGGSIPDVENYKSQLQTNAQVLANGMDVISNSTTSTQDLQRNKDGSCEFGSENCEVGNSGDSECQPNIVSQTVTCLDRQQGSGLKTQTEGKVTMSGDSAELHDTVNTTDTDVIFSSNVLNDQPMNSETIVNGSELPQETVENYTVYNSLVECFTEPERSSKSDTDMRVGSVDSTDLTSSIRISNAEVSEKPQIANAAQEENSRRETFDLLKSIKEYGVRNTVQLKYERRRKKRQADADQIRYNSNPILRKKRKRKGDQMLSVQLSCDGFVRSPCEGLRSRGGQAICENALSSMFKRTSQVKRHWSGHDGLVGRKSIDESSGPYQCNLQGCHMSFQTGRELSLHKQNRCTYEGCGKRFSSHKYAMRHQCVHADERPLKCPWKGCTVTFKWAWARTEHVRVHTGERPYKCEVPGCGLAFRFVSEFSRHRRKTGHSSG